MMQLPNFQLSPSQLGILEAAVSSLANLHMTVTWR